MFLEEYDATEHYDQAFTDMSEYDSVHLKVLNTGLSKESADSNIYERSKRFCLNTTPWEMSVTLDHT